MRRGPVRGRGEGVLEGAAQLRQSHRRRRWGGYLAGDLRPVRQLGHEGGVEGVEADQGVEVDDAAGLHLGDLGERCPRPVPLEDLVDLDEGAAPQLGHVGVPDHLPGVVVAVQAERLTHQRVSVVVADAAEHDLAVRAGLRQAPGSTGAGSAVAAGAGGVDGAEGGCGGGEEHARVLGDRVRDGLAADQAGLDELVGVRPVQLGAGGADARAAVPARGVQDAVGQVQRRRRREHAAGPGVDVVQPPAQPDRAGAFPGVDDVGQPPRVVRAAGPVDGGGDVRPDGEAVS